MKDLSMHIIDIARNSVRAGADLVEVKLEIDSADDLLKLTFRDNGCGMGAEMLSKVTDPFVSSRTSRRVGLGLPFLKMNAEMTGGELNIFSNPGEGTTVNASFYRSHIDCIPLGDLAGALALLMTGTPDVDFVFEINRAGNEFQVDSRDLKKELEGVPIWEPKVTLFLKDMLQENLADLQFE